MKRLYLAGFLLTVLFLSGCQGTGEISQLRIPHVDPERGGKASGLAVVVSPFDDQRPSSEHLGVRSHGGGEEKYFDVMDGTLSQRVTSSFVHFLNGAGFSASEGVESGDIRIEPVIKKFEVRAIGGGLSASLEVDAIMTFTIHNAADESVVRIAIGVGGTDNAMFSVQRDLETLIGEVLAEGFEEFLEKVEVQGKAIKFRLLEESS